MKESEMSYIDRKIEELMSPDGGNIQLTEEQKKALRAEMADYAFSACIDSAIRKEAEGICLENAKYDEEVVVS
jgi:hypothetical protein